MDNTFTWTLTSCPQQPVSPPLPPSPPPPKVDVVLDDELSLPRATEVMVLFGETGSDAMVQVSEVRILGRPAGTHVPHVVSIDTPLRQHTLGGNHSVRGFTFELAAEVINLERNVLITGLHERFVETTRGLHVMGAYDGIVRITHTRVEWCGQSAAQPPLGTGVLGRYCLHLHHISHCPECLLEGNAIEHGLEKGVTVHDTHDALVHRNVLWSVLGAGVYIEDGNEMNNTVSENVALCGDMPGLWNYADPQTPGGTLKECKLPGTGINGVGLYVIGMNNDYLGNRASGYETGIYTNGGSHGNGPASGLSCPIFTPFRRMEHNVMHDNRRWGLYLGNQMARNVVQDEDGFVRDRRTCGEFDEKGNDNGASPASVVADHLDWQVGASGLYMLRDIQWLRYRGVNNGAVR